jgi:uncharacterized protein (TIGR02145 family)/uncharacterized repeat protein (TIGR02543 family)
VFVENVESPGTTFHTSGAQVTIRAEAALGYRFTGWTGAVTSANATLSSVNIRANVELTANFEYIGTQTLTVNLEPSTGGKVFVNNVESTGITTHTTGASVTVRAETAAGYRFAGWSGASTAITVSVTVTMSVDRTLTANFEEGDGRGSFTDPRDNQTYRTVVIGTQTWMAENLNFAGHLLGDSWCYNNVPDSCARYGRLYTWEAAMAGSSSSTTSPSGVQGVCPAGWHLPSRAEWTTLVNFVGSSPGTKLKSSAPDWDGTDEYGFSALPGGLRSTVGSFLNVGSFGYWWSATESSATHAWSRRMGTGNDNVGEDSNAKGIGLSVLCVRTE